MVQGHGDETQVTPFTLALIALGLALHAVPRDLPGRIARVSAGMPAWTWGVTAGVGIAMIDAIGPGGVAPFIYFQF
jgi:alginate O-acetyltransferase complex protein AlgI